MASVYSVEQVNNYIKNMFDTDFLLKKISVSGEVSNCKYHQSGHIYFTLKDKNNVLSVVMFYGNRRGLDFRLEDGQKIVVTGNITVYEQSGKYQMYAKQIEKAGLGELFVKFNELKKQLEEMGMFDPMFKQPIPKYVKTIGVVTAPTGAAIHDIITVSKRRNPGVQIILYPAIIQGEYAVDSICRGISELEKQNVDVMIVGRGGGSIEDLWAFNEEKVARAIFDCKIPIISAVGHETDFTIADYVADLRAATPSAAAEIANFDFYAMQSTVNEYRRMLNYNFENIMMVKRNSLNNLLMQLKHLSPEYILAKRRQFLDEKWDRLNYLMNNIFDYKKSQYKVLCTRLDGLSPLKKLSQGYSYVANENGECITSIDEVRVDDKLVVNVLDGKIMAKVTDKTTMKREKQ